jgi:uncharacterized protein YndB with AHSA1/START domain
MRTSAQEEPEMADQALTIQGSEIVIERVFDAPVEQVWKAWTEPEQIKRWWGPKDFTTPHATMDFRVGGTYANCMRGAAGSEFDRDYWSTGVFKEIVPLRRIVFTDSFADEHGNIVSAAYYGMNAEMPLEMLVTVTFEDLGGKTKMTLRHEGLPMGEDRDGAGEGWSQMFDKLADVLRTQGQ